MPFSIEAILDDSDDDDLDQDMPRSQVVIQLDAIAKLAATALHNHGFEVPVFFLPGSGRSLVTFGTPDNSILDSDWYQIIGILKDVVREALGTGPLMTRPIPCAQALPGAVHREEQT